MKYRTRLVIYYLLASLLSMLLVGYGVAQSIQYSGMQTIEKDLIAQSESALIYIQQTLHLKNTRQQRPLNSHTARMITNSLSAGNRQVRIYNQNLQILSASRDGILQHNPPSVGRQERLVAAMNGDYGYRVSDNKVYFVSPLIFEGETIGVLEFVHPLHLLNGILEAVIRTLTSGAIIFTVLITILTLLISFRMMRPLRRLVAATERYAKRDFTPVGVHGTDEFAQLGRRLNYMGAQLQEYIERQRQFITNISHELSTPLTAIQAYADELQVKVQGRPDLEKTVRHLQKESERLGAMVQGLLTLSRVDARDELFLTRLNFSEMLYDAVDRLKMRADEYQIAIQTRIEPDLYVAGDEEKLFQAVINLLDNAIKFSSKQGKIDVEVRGWKGEVWLQVTDYGRGIPKADQDKVFQRFYRASNVDWIRGTGLGLAITQEVVSAHQGSIDLSQPTDGGTQVTVRLPLIKRR